jgi:glucokinase
VEKPATGIGPGAGHGDHASPEEAISLYLSGLGLAPGSIGSVCLSVAGPVSGDEFKFTNNHWRLSRTAFCKTLQVDELLLVNDFSAMALGMTRLQPGEFRVVCEGTPEPLRPAVVIGPGTAWASAPCWIWAKAGLPRCRGGRARSAPEQPA